MADLGQLWVTLGMNTAALVKGVAEIQRMQKQIQVATEAANKAQLTSTERTTAGQIAAHNRVAQASQVANTKIVADSTKAAALTASAWHSKINQVGYDFQRLGMTASMFITAPLALIGKGSFSTAMEIEFAAKKIVALAGVTGKTLDSWQGELSRISDSTGKTALELNTALYFITSSGQKGAEALKILDISAKASASGLGETDAISRLLVSSMNAYGKEVLTSARAGDILTAAVREGTAEASDMANQIGKVVPMAKLLGVSFAQVAGATAAMTLTGMNAAQATTSLTQIFTQLLKNSHEAVGLIAKDHQTLAMLRAELVAGNLPDVLDKINKIMEDSGNTLAQFFGNKRSLTGGLNLINDLERTKAVMLAVEMSAGDLSKGWREMDDTMKNQLKHATTALNDAFKTLGMSMRGSLISVFKDFTVWIKSVTKAYSELTVSAQKSIMVWVGVLAAIGPVSLFITLITRLMVGFNYAIKIVTVSLGFLRTAMLTSGVGAILVALGAVVALGVGLSMFSRRNEEAAISEKKLGEAAEAAKIQLQENFDSIKDMMTTTPKMNPYELDAQILKVKKEIEELKNGYASKAKEIQAIIDKDPIILKLKAKMDSSDPDVRNSYIAGTDRYISKKYNIPTDSLTSNIPKLDSLLLADRRAKLLELANTTQATDTIARGAIAIYQADIAIMEQLKKEYKGKEVEFENTEKNKRAADAIKGAYDDYANGLQRIIALRKVFGESVDVLGFKFNAEEESYKILGNLVNALGDTSERNTPKFKNLTVELIRMTQAIRDKELSRLEAAGINTTKDTGYLPSRAKSLPMFAQLGGQLEVSIKGIQNNGWLNKELIPTLVQEARHRKEINRLMEQARVMGVDPKALKNIKESAQGYEMQKIFLEGLLEPLTEAEIKFQEFNSNFQWFGQKALEFIQTYTEMITNKQQKAYAFIDNIAKREYKSAEWVTKQKEKLDAEYNRKKKIASIASVAINGAMAVMNLAATLPGSVLNPLFYPMAALIAGLTIAQTAIINGAGMAQGGTIPSGYPNDSYPARLTSGEIVVPPGKLPEFRGGMNPIIIHLTGKLLAEGNDLVYVMDKQITVNNSY